MTARPRWLVPTVLRGRRATAATAARAATSIVVPLRHPPRADMDRGGAHPAVTLQTRARPPRPCPPLLAGIVRPAVEERQTCHLCLTTAPRPAAGALDQGDA